jgi:hypothetical protein
MTAEASAMVGRSGVDDVLAPWEFEELFRTAASIRDLDLAIEMAFLLYTPGRLGPRNGAVLHVDEDWLVYNAAGEIVALRIPTAVPDCECTRCWTLARRRAGDDEDASEYIDEYWSPKSHAGGRSIPVLQQRGREVLELAAVEEFSKPNMSAQLYRNRLARLEELCDAVDVNLYPQTLRATAVNYWSMWGLGASSLRQLFGWKYISTAQFYQRKSDVLLRWHMQRALGRRPSTPYTISTEPPTFFDVRPEDDDELIDVDHLTPESQQSPAAAGSGDDVLEEHAQEELQNAELSDFSAGVDPVSPLVRRRLELEREALRASDRFEYPPSRATAATAVGALSVVTVALGVFFGVTGLFAIDPTGPTVHTTPETAASIALVASVIIYNAPEI